MNTSWLLSRLLLALVAMQSNPLANSEYACRFNEQIIIEYVPLPQGISLSVQEESGDERTGIYIENQTSELLLVLSLHYQEQLATPVTPDPHYDTRLRFAHEVASYLVPSEGQSPLLLSMGMLFELDPNLLEPRCQVASPPGEEAIIPSAQSSMLLLVHGNKVLRVPFTITYRLDPEYEPAAGKEQRTGMITPAVDGTQSPLEKPASVLERSLPGLALLVLVIAALLGASLLGRKPRN